MSTFTYTQEERQRQIGNKKLLLWSVILITLLIAILNAYLFLKINEESFDQFIGGCILLIFAVIIIAYFMINLITKKSGSISITILDDRIVEEQTNRPKIVIRRSQIKNVVEVKNQGISISSVDQTNKIFATQNIIDYDRLKAELSFWHTITLESGSKAFFSESIRILRMPIALSIFLLFLQSRFEEKWEPVRITIISLIYIFWIILQFDGGRRISTTDEEGYISKEDTPILYWFNIIAWSSILLIVLFESNPVKILQYPSDVFFCILSLFLIWLYFVYRLFKKHSPDDTRTAL